MAELMREGIGLKERSWPPCTLAPEKATSPQLCGDIATIFGTEFLIYSVLDKDGLFLFLHLFY